MFSCNPVITTYYRKLIGNCQYEEQDFHTSLAVERFFYLDRSFRTPCIEARDGKTDRR
jgi:hypothetical protein